MNAVVAMAPALVSPRVSRSTRPPGHVPTNLPAVVVPAPAVQASLRSGPTHAHAQGGFLDLLGGAVPGLLGAASSALSGDTTGALGAVRATGASLAPALVQQGASALGGMIGGGAGQLVSSLGAPVGQGLGSVISGQSSPGEAAGGLLSAIPPQLLTMLASLFHR